MNGEQLYRRVMKGKRVSYEPFVEPEQEPVVHNLTDRQALTVAASLGCTLLILFERHFPAHQRSARKIKAVERAILDLFAGSGEQLDPEIADWVCKCWDETMRRAEGLPVRGAA